MNPACNFCNNTNDVCCPEVDNKAARHIISREDENHHNEADAHVFMMNGLLVAKDVVMPREIKGN